MDITLEEPQVLANDPQVKALPAALGFSGHAPWQDAVHEVTRLATEMDIWFAAYHAATWSAWCSMPARPLTPAPDPAPLLA